MTYFINHQGSLFINVGNSDSVISTGKGSLQIHIIFRQFSKPIDGATDTMSVTDACIHTKKYYSEI